MNYFKLIRTTADKSEEAFNAFFQEVDERGHRIMHTVYRMQEPTMGQVIIYGLFTVNDEANPHKRK